MYAHKNINFHFLLGFLIGIAILAVAVGQQKQCQGFQGYCQNHWDCCSNTCMHYSYKCTRPKPAVPETLWGHPYPSPSTLEEIIEMNFGKIKEQGNELDGPSEFQSRFGEALPQARQLDLSDAEATDTELKTTQAPDAAAEAITKASQEETTPTPVTISASCSEIGAKCYSHLECCTQRCHGFLHQCVT